MSRQHTIQLTLFIVTFFTTTFSGMEWIYSRSLFTDFTWAAFLDGMKFSVPFLLILTSHEFGHYLAAKYHDIKVTLPYYIPQWFFGFLPAFGTMGAFIRIREDITAQKKYFDIGIAGPLAGFLVAIGFIFYGFLSLPTQDHIFEIHPEYESLGENYEIIYDIDTFFLKKDIVNKERFNYGVLRDSIVYNTSFPSISLGNNLIFSWMKTFVVKDKSRIPNKHEMFHYPFLFAGYLALLFTALNLLPIGQLDGGHIAYAMFGAKKTKLINQVVFIGLLLYAGLGAMSILLKEVLPESFGGFLLWFFAYLYTLSKCFYSMFENPRDRWMWAAIVVAAQFVLVLVFAWEGYMAWLLFCFIIGRYLGVYHPIVQNEKPLDGNRILLGYVALAILVLSLIPTPLVME